MNCHFLLSRYNQHHFLGRCHYFIDAKHSLNYRFEFDLLFLVNVNYMLLLFSLTLRKV